MQCDFVKIPKIFAINFLVIFHLRLFNLFKELCSKHFLISMHGFYACLLYSCNKHNLNTAICHLVTPLWNVDGVITKRMLCLITAFILVWTVMHHIELRRKRHRIQFQNSILRKQVTIWILRSYFYNCIDNVSLGSIDSFQQTVPCFFLHLRHLMN
jgi:hypothetical protein